MRHRLFPWCRGLSLLFGGAFGLLLFFWLFSEANLPPQPLTLIVQGFALLFTSAAAWADPRPRKPSREPHQAIAGAGVVFICGIGLSAAAMVATEAGSSMRYILPILGIVATLALTAIVYRFASRHEGEIGEARFRTTPERDAGA